LIEIKTAQLLHPQVIVPFSVWNVVLAAGAGRRLAAVTGGTPKQFWRPPGRESLLDATLARIAPLAPPSRTIAVIDRSHARHLSNLGMPPGIVAFQPDDRGTAAGMLFGLITLLEFAPEATVVVTPSDHAIDRPRFFCDSVRAVVTSIRRGAAQVVVFGVEPTMPASDYGWIKPGLAIPGWPLLSTVTGFVEKPPQHEAERLMASGAVWNTMVVVAQVKSLLALYARHLPELYDVFMHVAAVPAVQRQAVFEVAYPLLAHHDFSHEILARADRLSVATWPISIGWSDLGTPDRLAAWLARSPVHSEWATA
jgi:mannose-1-phosphate guanylyltransferase